MNRRTLLAGGGLGAVGLALGVGPWASGCRGRRSGARGVASLAPAITETAFALERGGRLVARTPWCVLPPEAASLPVAGSGITPNLEALATLGPEVILVDNGGAAQAEVLGRLATVEVLPWLTWDEVRTSVTRLGAIFGATGEADRLVVRLTEGLAPAVDVGPRALVLLATPEIEAGGPVWFIKGRSLHGDGIVAAGYRHAVEPDFRGEPRLPVEALIAADPEVVVVVSGSPTGSFDLGPARRALRRLPIAAARTDAVHLLEGAEMLSIGPSILRFVDALRRTRAP